MVFIKILTLIMAIFICTLIIRYREWLVRQIGKNDFAERYLGNGGTYTMWILIAIFIVIIAVVWLVGTPWG